MIVSHCMLLDSNSRLSVRFKIDALAGGPAATETRLSEVIIQDDENFERALRRFKKKCERAGILSDLRKHRHYEKSSERRNGS